MAPPAPDVLARVMDSDTEDIYDSDYSNKDEQDTELLAAGACKGLTSAVKSDEIFKRAILLSRLKCKRSGQILSFGNVHLSWTHTKRERVLLEVAMAINALIEFAGSVDNPHILCGDFNQEFWMLGYKLLHNGSVSRDDIEELKKHTIAEAHNETDEPVFLVDVLPDKIKHQSKHLKSAYEVVTGAEATFTLYQDNRQADHQLQSSTTEEREISPREVFRACGTNLAKNYEHLTRANVSILALDYFWFGSDKLECTGVLEMPEESIIAPFHGCPNEVFPSDHFLMKAQFKFIC